MSRALAGAGLMAHALVSKYADHTPLNRLSQIFARDGVQTAVSNRADMAFGPQCGERAVDSRAPSSIPVWVDASEGFGPALMF